MRSVGTGLARPGVQESREGFDAIDQAGAAADDEVEPADGHDDYFWPCRRDLFPGGLD
jgi:hypothetical protein